MFLPSYGYIILSHCSVLSLCSNYLSRVFGLPIQLCCYLPICTEAAFSSARDMFIYLFVVQYKLSGVVACQIM